MSSVLNHLFQNIYPLPALTPVLCCGLEGVLLVKKSRLPASGWQTWDLTAQSMQSLKSRALILDVILTNGDCLLFLNQNLNLVFESSARLANFHRDRSISSTSCWVESGDPPSGTREPWTRLLADLESFVTIFPCSLPVSHQILQKVLQGCRENMLGTMALAACQFMEEPGMEVQVRESKHPYNNNTNFEVRASGGQTPPASGHGS